MGQTRRDFSVGGGTISNVSDFRFEVEVVQVSGDMAYTLGFERFNGSIAGRPVEPVTVRVTHIYLREDGGWKIIHRHADNPGPDTRMGDLGAGWSDAPDGTVHCRG
jgi:ketosteroid isomerase-like protein